MSRTRPSEKGPAESQSLSAPSVAILLRLPLRFPVASENRGDCLGPESALSPHREPCDVFLRRKVASDCDIFCDFSTTKRAPTAVWLATGTFATENQGGLRLRFLVLSGQSAEVLFFKVLGIQCSFVYPYPSVSDIAGGNSLWDPLCDRECNWEALSRPSSHPPTGRITQPPRSKPLGKLSRVIVVL